MQKSQFEALVNVLEKLGESGTHPATDVLNFLRGLPANTDEERDQAVQAAQGYATAVSGFSALRNILLEDGVDEEERGNAMKYLTIATALLMANEVAKATALTPVVVEAPKPVRERPIVGLNENEPGEWDRYDSDVEYHNLIASMGLEIVGEQETGEGHNTHHFALFNPQTSEYGLLTLLSTDCEICDRLSQCENPGAVYELRDALQGEIEWYFGPSTAMSAMALKIAGSDDDESNEALLALIRSVRQHKERVFEIPF